MFSKNLVSQTSKIVINEKQEEVKSEWLEIKKNWLSVYSKRRLVQNKKPFGSILMIHGYYSQKDLINVKKIILI